MKSDLAVPDDLRQKLCLAVAPLENIGDSDKDWHPGSEEQVLDLVHPSLYPLVYGQSRIVTETVETTEESIERCGQGMVLPIPSEESVSNPYRKEAAYFTWHAWDDKLWSRQFQWLPSEFWCPPYSSHVK